MLHQDLKSFTSKLFEGFGVEPDQGWFDSIVKSNVRQ